MGLGKIHTGCNLSPCLPCARLCQDQSGLCRGVLQAHPIALLSHVQSDTCRPFHNPVQCKQNAVVTLAVKDQWGAHRNKTALSKRCTVAQQNMCIEDTSLAAHAY